MFSKSRFKITLFAALLFFSFSGLSASIAYSQDTTNNSSLRLVFSNNMAGDYKPCG